MKIVFFGTPDYVLPVLEKLHKEFSFRGVSPITAVVTQPPRPSGRKQLLTFSPVDSWAFKKKLPIFHQASQVLKEKPEADVAVLASYGEIISKEVIEYFPYGILNIHPSLLPKWRGAAPVQAPIIAGENVTGASIIKLDEKLDHGPIVSQFKEEIKETDTTETLRARLFDRGAEVLVELLNPYIKGKVVPKKQKHSEATFASQIKKEHAFLPADYLEAAIKGLSLKNKWEIGFMKDFSINPTPATINQFIKALSPWPSAWTYVKIKPKAEHKRFKILTACLEGEKLVLDTVQLEGKGPVSWKQFQAAYSEAAFEE